MEKEIEILEALEEDSRWVTEHYEELQKYEGKVITVKNKVVILTTDNIEDAIVELEKRGENTAFLLMETIPPKNASFIL